MAGWIFRIREANPEHLAIAVDRGYWDFEPELDVRAGDDIYFWQGGKRSHLRAMARALSSPRVLQEGDEHPWNDDVQYVWRVSLELLNPAPSEDVNWGRLKSTVVDRGLFTQDPVYKLSDEDSARIAELFTASEEELQLELPLEEGSPKLVIFQGQGERAISQTLSAAVSSRCSPSRRWPTTTRVRAGASRTPTSVTPTTSSPRRGRWRSSSRQRGTQQDGLEVEVTDGEVQFARRNPGMCQMGIVSGIRILDEGRVDPASGSLMIFDWDPDAGTLRPTRYRFTPGLV